MTQVRYTEQFLLCKRIIGKQVIYVDSRECQAILRSKHDALKHSSALNQVALDKR